MINAIMCALESTLKTYLQCAQKMHFQMGKKCLQNLEIKTSKSKIFRA
jgi:hypothetical protein